jgi:hypothetical protein
VSVPNPTAVRIGPPLAEIFGLVPDLLSPGEDPSNGKGQLSVALPPLLTDAIGWELLGGHDKHQGRKCADSGLC